VRAPNVAFDSTGGPAAHEGAVLPGPLHRLTRLKEDPAGMWLLPLDRIIVTLKGWSAWALYGAFLYGVRWAVEFMIETLLHTSGQSLPRIAAGVVGLTLRCQDGLSWARRRRSRT
jgi:hypothetical protein